MCECLFCLPVNYMLSNTFPPAWKGGMGSPPSSAPFKLLLLFECTRVARHGLSAVAYCGISLYLPASALADVLSNCSLAYLHRVLCITHSRSHGSCVPVPHR